MHKKQKKGKFIVRNEFLEKEAANVIGDLL